VGVPTGTSVEGLGVPTGTSVEGLGGCTYRHLCRGTGWVYLQAPVERGTGWVCLQAGGWVGVPASTSEGVQRMCIVGMYDRLQCCRL
jgi:hypothetical protein